MEDDQLTPTTNIVQSKKKKEKQATTGVWQPILVIKLFVCRLKSNSKNQNVDQFNWNLSLNTKIGRKSCLLFSSSQEA